MVTPSVLVYGTSVAALRSAATFSKQGYIVYLINSGRYLGDIPNILSYKKPRTICNTCLRFFLNRQPTMRIMNQAEIINITGNAGEFTVKIRKRTPDVDEKKCIECGLCLGKEGVSVIERPMANNVYLIDRKKALAEKCLGPGRSLRVPGFLKQSAYRAVFDHFPLPPSHSIGRG